MQRASFLAPCIELGNSVYRFSHFLTDAMVLLLQRHQLCKEAVQEI